MTRANRSNRQKASLLNESCPEQCRNFGLQHDLFLNHTAIAHRLVLGGVGLPLGAIQRAVAQFHQADPLVPHNTWTDNVVSAARCWVRKLLMVRKSGRWFAVSTR